MAAEPTAEEAALAVAPNAVQVKKLQEERIARLDDKRHWEIRRDEAIKNHDAAEARLKIVEQALEGVKIGLNLAAEVAANPVLAKPPE